MRVAVFSTKSYDRTFLEAANARHHHELIFFEAPLVPSTAALAQAWVDAHPHFPGMSQG